MGFGLHVTDIKITKYMYILSRTRKHKKDILLKTGPFLKHFQKSCNSNFYALFSQGYMLFLFLVFVIRYYLIRFKYCCSVCFCLVHPQLSFCFLKPLLSLSFPRLFNFTFKIPPKLNLFLVFVFNFLTFLWDTLLIERVLSFLLDNY